MVGIFGASVEGGVFHAIIGTLWVTGLCSLVAIPLGILTAVYLVEYARPGPLKRAITVLVDVMTGIPSIVAGLFAATLFMVVVGPQYKAGVMGAVALALLMTPVVVRSVEEMLRLVPNELREAAYALGVPKWLTVVKVVLRTAVAGITTGAPRRVRSTCSGRTRRAAPASTAPGPARSPSSSSSCCSTWWPAS